MLCCTFTTGTEKQFVADDYYLQLYKGTVACAQLSATLLAEILSASSDSTPTLYVVSLCIMVLTTWQACCTILNYDALCPLLLLLTFPCCTSLCVWIPLTSGLSYSCCFVELYGSICRLYLFHGDCCCGVQLTGLGKRLCDKCAH